MKMFSFNLVFPVPSNQSDIHAPPDINMLQHSLITHSVIVNVKLTKSCYYNYHALPKYIASSFSLSLFPLGT